jgi:hypothetical protein
LRAWGTCDDQTERRSLSGIKVILIAKVAQAFALLLLRHSG